MPGLAFEDILKTFLHSSPCQHVYSVCKESWATTACGAYLWGRSMDSRVSVCCEYPSRRVRGGGKRRTDVVFRLLFYISVHLLLFHPLRSLAPFHSGLSMVTTYHWYQREPSKTCHRSPTCEWHNNTHTQTHTHCCSCPSLGLESPSFHLIELQNKENTLSWQKSLFEITRKENIC